MRANRDGAVTGPMTGDGDLHVVEDGERDAPALLLIHGTGACTAW